MRRAFLGVLAAVAVVSAGTASVSAAAPTAGRWFVDADGNGVCDYAESRWGDTDEDGICDFCGADHSACLTGDGTVFADADGDGICDNCGAFHWCGTAGGCGGNYVDADGDGICDNYAACPGRGMGRGRGCGRGNGFRGGCRR